MSFCPDTSLIRKSPNSWAVIRGRSHLWRAWNVHLRRESLAERSRRRRTAYTMLVDDEKLALMPQFEPVIGVIAKASIINFASAPTNCHAPRTGTNQDQRRHPEPAGQETRKILPLSVHRCAEHKGLPHKARVLEVSRANGSRSGEFASVVVLPLHAPDQASIGTDLSRAPQPCTSRGLPELKHVARSRRIGSPRCLCRLTARSRPSHRPG